MIFNNLHAFLAELERQGELLRIKEPVSPILEITQWADVTVKNGGPALLFENVAGSAMPVAINLFGSKKRTALALGVTDLQEIADEIQQLLHQRPPETIIEKLKMLPLLARLASFPPRKVRSGPCQEVVLRGEQIDLTTLPALKCWPQDGGRYFTLTNVFTKDPNGLPNCGMYRIQIFDRNTCAMHWHLHHDGARHFRAFEALDKRMPVAVSIGGDPTVVYSATAPLPPGIDEMLMAGFLRKRPVEMVPCVSQPNLYVPAEAELVLEGYLEPAERRREGPFGDHTGFYSLADDYPVFHVTAVTHRKDPIYQTIVVGMPPMEDTYLGLATERIFLPFLKLTLPEIVDYKLPEFGVFHNCAFFSINKQYPQHARKLMHAIWGLGQIMFTKIIVVVDAEVNVQDEDLVWAQVIANCDFARDLEMVKGPTDILDHASRHYGWTGKLGIDATRKLADEGIERPWPEQRARSTEIRVRDLNFTHPDVVSVRFWQYGDTPLFAFAALNKTQPNQARQLMQAIWSNPLTELVKFVVVVDGHVDLSRHDNVWFHVGSNCDFTTDLVVQHGPATESDYASQFMGRCGKLGIDATKKWPEEGFNREWPDYIEMDESVRTKVAEQLARASRT